MGVGRLSFRSINDLSARYNVSCNRSRCIACAGVAAPRGQFRDAGRGTLVNWQSHQERVSVLGTVSVGRGAVTCGFSAVGRG